jgi:GT2 family glycosyltransferase
MQTVQTNDSIGTYVVGMHRSGTSVSTRLLNLLGVPMCKPEDLLGGMRGNPKGLWESATLVKFNDALLHTLRSEWWCPPRPNNAWIYDSSIAARMNLAEATFSAVHPTPQWVWKDPRNCITLPFWCRALESRPVVVLMVRNPLEIAASLSKRDKFAPSISIALWERYLQNVLPHLRGLPVLVTNYEDLVKEPLHWCKTAYAFLCSQRVELNKKWDETFIHGFVEPTLRHHGVSDSGQIYDLSPSQRTLYQLLLNVVGPHSEFVVPTIPVETPDTDKIFEQIRRSYALARRAPDFSGFNVRSSARKAPTGSAPRPPVSVVVVSHNEGPALRRTVQSILRTVPPTSEILIVDDGSDDGSTQEFGKGFGRVRLLRSEARLGISGARNLGADQSKGEIVIISDAHVIPSEGWFEPLMRELSDAEVGAVGPALAPLGRPKLRVYGLAFRDTALNVTWLPQRERGSYAVPLLPGCFLAVRRSVFHLVGGFDTGMVGYGAEDLEFCMRLWRMGLECRIVPKSQVRHRFRVHRRHTLDWESFLYNVLRLGTLHLGSSNLEQFVATLQSDTSFGQAMARILAGDTLQRRAEIKTLSRFDDAWFFERFDVNVFSNSICQNGQREN